MISNFEQLSNDRFLVNFINLKDFDRDSLQTFCYKVTQKHLYFKLGKYEKRIIPLDIINELIEKKTSNDITISILTMIGKEIGIIYLEDCILLKTKNLLDFDYSTIGPMKIKVKFKFEKMKIFNDRNDFFKYQRKRKLCLINNSTIF